MEEILIEEYNYPLPDERIAKYPLAERDQSKLLVYREGEVSEDKFYRVGEYVPTGSLLIYNNTRVIQARLEFHKEAGDEAIRLIGDKARGARIEIFCLEPLEPHDYQLSLGSTEGCTWKCMIGNAKKWKSGALSQPVVLPSGKEVKLWAEKGEQTGNTFSVRFSWEGASVSFAEILDAVGELPIPPYLNRKTEESDKTTYQTVYSRIKGSVAAPTAGLHFTDNVLNGLRERGVKTAEVTLHVGAGTFQPVKVADANQHTMHTEIIAVPKATIQTIIENLGHIMAVGTTSMRTLESLYFLGEQFYTRHMTQDIGHLTYSVSQFEPYEKDHALSTQEALQAIVDHLEQIGEEVLHAETQIMIKPGYIFHVVDQLITNFHQPKSTLLLLVSAFVGGDWHTIYDYALSHDFRFLSYGDSSILTRATKH
jgi:S-adenosylmethionine:tRNA ribosyltransferase-isomerase